MSRHPLRHRLGLLEAERGVGPEEYEIAEVQNRQRAAEQVLDRREVGFRPEQFGDPLGRLARADAPEQEEDEREAHQRDLETPAAIADRLDRAAIEPRHEEQHRDRRR